MKTNTHSHMEEFKSIDSRAYQISRKLIKNK